MLVSQHRAPVLGVLILSVATLLGAGHVRASAEQTGAPVEYVAMPDTWVPFEASVTITAPNSPPVVGRFYRSSNGSTRLETGPSVSDIRVISIRNIVDQMIYLGSASGWTSDRLDLPFGSGPMRWKKGLPNWTPFEYKLAIRRGESGSVSATEGFDAYRVTQSDGVMHLKVPALNLFDAVVQRPDGWYQLYSNIDLKEPAADLFAPPLGVPVAPRALRPPPLPTPR
jgi:hypothetical protein